MATVWLKPHFYEEEGTLGVDVFMNLCSWGNEHRLTE